MTCPRVSSLLRHGRLRAGIVALLAAPTAAYAHPLDGGAHDPWRTWTWEPPVVVGLALTAWLYACGWRAIAQRRRRRALPTWRAAAFVGGMMALAIALLSPIDRVAAALFSVHMTQHLLLVMIAAPLLVLGDIGRVTFWALPVRVRRALPRRLHRLTRIPPVLAWTLHVAALWAWHIPRAYEAALRSTPLHALEHATFIGTALLFWSPLLAPLRRRRLHFAPSAIYLFAAGLQCTALGALITFSRDAWYPAHAASTLAFGLTPLEDQQLAGLIMWIPAGIVYLSALIALGATRRTPAPSRRSFAAAA